MRSGSVGTANAYRKAGGGFRSHVAGRYVTMTGHYYLQILRSGPLSYCPSSCRAVYHQLRWLKKTGKYTPMQLMATFFRLGLIFLILFSSGLEQPLDSPFTNCCKSSCLHSRNPLALNLMHVDVFWCHPEAILSISRHRHGVIIRKYVIWYSRQIIPIPGAHQLPNRLLLPPPAIPHPCPPLTTTRSTAEHQWQMTTTWNSAEEWGRIETGKGQEGARGI